MIESGEQTEGEVMEGMDEIFPGEGLRLQWLSGRQRRKPNGKERRV